MNRCTIEAISYSNQAETIAVSAPLPPVAVGKAAFLRAGQLQHHRPPQVPKHFLGSYPKQMSLSNHIILEQKILAIKLHIHVVHFYICMRVYHQVSFPFWTPSLKRHGYLCSSHVWHTISCRACRHCATDNPRPFGSQKASACKGEQWHSPRNLCQSLQVATSHQKNPLRLGKPNN